MSALALARRHYRLRQRLITAVVADARRLWRQVDVADLDGWFRQYGPRLVVMLAAAQLAAARAADGYVTDTLEAQGIDPDPLGHVAAAAFSGLASDGRTLDGLLLSPVLTVKEAIGQGARPRLAVARGWAHLDMILSTQVADAGRTADGAALAARPRVGGYVRMLQGKSCSRCVILAGRWYRWNAGFDRHPRCDCIHIPAAEDQAGDLRTDPRQYFDSLTEAEQDRAFTKAGAQAIRDGADMNQVVNARRGARGLNTAAGRRTREEARALRDGRDRGSMQTERVYGRDAFITTEGTTSRGIAGRRLADLQKIDGQRYRRSRTPRLMPEQIYRDATSREDAIRLLRRFGYII